MTVMWKTGAFVALAALAACATQPPAPQPLPPAKAMLEPPTNPAAGASVTAPIIDAKGATVGRAVFTEGAAGVLIHVETDAGALAPGWHGMHFHEIGACDDAAAGFKVSGMHVGHDPSVLHGLLSLRGPEAADLPNLFVSGASAAGAEAFSPAVTLAASSFEGRKPLLDADGSALVIHASADDHKTQPIGGAGERVACAALKSP